MKLKKFKEKRLCGGKLVVTDFKRLNPEEGLFLGDFQPERNQRPYQKGGLYGNS